MSVEKKCELILKTILDAVLAGRTVTVRVTEEEEHNSDRWVVVESPHYLCLMAPYMLAENKDKENFDFLVHHLSRGLKEDV